jgi:uncharacterized repeat protein (TIGR01451 family)
MGEYFVMNKNRFLILILLALCIQLFFLMSADAVTKVSGAISSDTTWTLAGSPYHAVNNPAGTGNAVCDGVDYSNYLTSEGQATADLTRAELAKMLVEKLGLPVYLPGEPTFSDVPLDYWAAGYIYSVVERGILSGFEDGTFGPELNPVRYRFASLLYRIFCIPEYIPDSPTYSDVSPDHEAYEAIESLTHAGIFRGNPDGTFRPGDTVAESVATAVFEEITTYCGSISGKVTDEQQNPLNGAHVWAEYYEEGNRPIGTLTDEAGNYVIHGVSPGQYRVIAQAGGRVKRFYNNTLIYDQAEPVIVTAGQTTGGINFALEQGGAISGTVTDDKGNPLEGISLGCGMIDQSIGNGAETDANGAYTIIGLPFGTYKVNSPDPGRWGENDDNWAEEWYNQKDDWDQADPVTISISAPNVGGINFSLTQGGSVTGKVTDGQGNPLANADIWADYYESRDWAGGTRTDNEGSFIIQGLAAGQYRVGAQAAGHVKKFYNNTLIYDQAEPVSVTAGQSTSGINFALEPGGAISGTIADSQGNPISGADVWADYYESRDWAGSARTDNEGNYTIQVLQSGQYRVGAQVAGHVQKFYNNTLVYDQAEPVIVTAGQTTSGINFALEPSGAISGTVTDGQGNPLSGISVQCEGIDQSYGNSAETDANGVYTITGLPFGTYKVNSPDTGRWGDNDDNWAQEWYDQKAGWDQADPVTISISAPNAGGINFSLTQGGGISGKVTDNQGNPISGADVWADYYESRDGAGGTQTDEEGNYTLYSLSPGQYRVGAKVAGHVKKFYNNTLNYDEAESVSVAAGQTTSGINFALEPGGAISGTVTDGQGNPLSGISVQCESIDQSYGNSAETDANGAYTITGLSFGTFKVRSPDPGRWGDNDGNWAQEWYDQKTGWDQADPVTISISAPNAGGINFSLTQGGSVTGKVTDDQGNPLANADVWADYYESQDWAGGTRTDNEGNYTIRGLADGQYRVGAQAAGHVKMFYNNTLIYDQAQTVSVTAGQTRSGINFSLEQGGTISGAVTDEQGNPLSGISVQCDSIDQSYGNGSETDTNGLYTITGLPFGTYKVYSPAFSRWGDNDDNWAVKWYNQKAGRKQANQVTISILTPDAVDIDFSLIKGGSVTGKVTDGQGNPLANADVWADYYDIDDQAGHTQADGEGNYIIQGLPDGRYRIGAEAGGHVRRFYDNTPRHGQSAPVEVTAGQTTSGINFSLEQGGTISGTVTDSQGNPLGGVSIECDAVGSAYSHGAETDSNGIYTLTGLPFGTYRLLSPSSGRWGENDDNWAGKWYYQKDGWDRNQANSVTISLSAPDIADIDFTLIQGGSVTGQITDDQGNPLPGANVWADYYESGDRASAARTDENGAYRLQGLEDGLYRVGAEDSGRVRKYYNDTLRYDQAASVNVTAGQTLGGINIALERGGTISGAVTDKQGNPLGGISVQCDNVDQPYGGGAETISDGTYILTGLPFGTYKVFSPASDRWGENDGDWTEEWYNQKSGSDQADPVLISSGSPDLTGVNFTLEQEPLTRAKLAKMLVEKSGLSQYLPQDPTFTDVPLSHWAAGYIYSAIKYGLMSGYQDGTFRPEQYVTRAEIAAFSYDKFNIPSYVPQSPTYVDLLPDHWAYEAVESLTNAGFMGGYPDGTFRPDDFITISDAESVFQSIKLPELVVYSISAPLHAIPLATIDISYTINNIGEGDAARFTHGCFFCASQERNPDCATIYASEQEEINIPAAHSYTVSKQFLIPDVPAGTYYISARAEYAGHTCANASVLVRPIIIGEAGGLSGTHSEGSDAAEDLRSRKATLKNGTIKVLGNLCGNFEFTDMEIIDIETGTFAGKGFSKGEWAATINGNQYSGYFEGVSYLLTSENKIYLKGVIGGQARGVFEGNLTQSAAGNGNYDQYSSTWKVNLGGSVSAVLNAAGTLVYTDPVSYPATRLHTLQTGIDGLTTGDYAEPINTVLTHVRVDDETNPYNGRGFSIISYASGRGSGEGWTCDKVTASGVVENSGMFSAPLSGIVLGNLDESETPVKQYISIENLALTPMADLEVKSWGPEQVSPGQEIHYVVQYRNDGFNSAENVVVVLKLPIKVSYLSSTGGGIYRWENNEVIWKLGTVPPQSMGTLTCKVLVCWGLTGHTMLEGVALIGTTSDEIDVSYYGISPVDLEEYLNAQPSVPPDGEVKEAEPGELDKLLQDQDFTDKYNFALSQGYQTEDVVQKIDFNNGTSLCGPLLVNSVNRDFLWVVKFTDQSSDSSSFIFRISESGFSVLDENGELKFLPDGTTEVRSAPCTSSQYSMTSGQETPKCYYLSCVNNCFISEAISFAAGEIASAMGAEAGCLFTVTTQDYSPCKNLFNNLGDQRNCLLSVFETLTSCGVEISKKYNGYVKLATFLYKVADCTHNCIKNKELDPGFFMCIPGETKSICGEYRNKYNYQCQDNCSWKIVSVDNCQSNCPSGRCVEHEKYKAVCECAKEPNTDDTSVEIITAEDPNAKYGPEGSVLAGEKLNYKVEFENEGEGIAFGVYFNDTLDEDLDASTLEIGPVYSTADNSQIAPAGIYNPATRTITWFVGEVGSKEGGYAEISVNVRADAPGGTEIINYATVYFPSVPETTLTNAIVSVINPTDIGITGSFTFQVAPESANIPQAEVSLWAEGANRSTAAPVLTKNVDVTATGNSGAFQLTGLQPGNYDITFKLPYSLRAVETNITITNDTMTPVNFGEITLGDTWGEEGPDNVVDVSDYSAILYSFGSIPGDGKYIDTCDLNRDGVVDVTDYSIVLYNFGKYGDAPF